MSAREPRRTTRRRRFKPAPLILPKRPRETEERAWDASEDWGAPGSWEERRTPDYDAGYGFNRTSSVDDLIVELERLYRAEAASDLGQRDDGPMMVWKTAGHLAGWFKGFIAGIEYEVASRRDWNIERQAMWDEDPDETPGAYEKFQAELVTDEEHCAAAEARVPAYYKVLEELKNPPKITSDQTKDTMLAIDNVINTMHVDYSLIDHLEYEHDDLYAPGLSAEDLHKMLKYIAERSGVKDKWTNYNRTSTRRGEMKRRLPDRKIHEALARFDEGVSPEEITDHFERSRTMDWLMRELGAQKRELSRQRDGGEIDKAEWEAAVRPLADKTKELILWAQQENRDWTPRNKREWVEDEAVASRREAAVPDQMAVEFIGAMGDKWGSMAQRVAEGDIPNDWANMHLGAQAREAGLGEEAVDRVIEEFGEEVARAAGLSELEMGFAPSMQLPGASAAVGYNATPATPHSDEVIESIPELAGMVRDVQLRGGSWEFILRRLRRGHDEDMADRLELLLNDLGLEVGAMKLEASASEWGAELAPLVDALGSFHDQLWDLGDKMDDDLEHRGAASYVDKACAQVFQAIQELGTAMRGVGKAAAVDEPTLSRAIDDARWQLNRLIERIVDEWGRAEEAEYTEKKLRIALKAVNMAYERCPRKEASRTTFPRPDGTEREQAEAKRPRRPKRRRDTQRAIMDMMSGAELDGMEEAGGYAVTPGAGGSGAPALIQGPGVPSGKYGGHPLRPRVWPGGPMSGDRDWKKDPADCPDCGWSGTVGDIRHSGEWDLCPQCGEQWWPDKAKELAERDEEESQGVEKYRREHGTGATSGKYGGSEMDVGPAIYVTVTNNPDAIELFDMDRGRAAEISDRWAGEMYVALEKRFPSYVVSTTVGDLGFPQWFIDDWGMGRGQTETDEERADFFNAMGAAVDDTKVLDVDIRGVDVGDELYGEIIDFVTGEFYDNWGEWALQVEGSRTTAAGEWELGGSSKQMVEMIVGRMHVGTSDDEVAETIRRQVSKDAPEEFVQNAIDYALEVHHRNFDSYKWVMDGGHRGSRREARGTRFQQELSGELGEYWAQHARDEIERMGEKFYADAEVDESGVVRWKSNGNCVPYDVAEMMEAAGCEFSREETAKARDEQDRKFLDEYRRVNRERVPSAEEQYEMVSAFGPGETVVDAITGEETKLPGRKGGEESDAPWAWVITEEEARDIGDQLGVDWDNSPFDVDQFRDGLEVELEHGTRGELTDVTGDDPLETGEIALAHLHEMPDYYTRLKKMEGSAMEHTGKEIGELDIEEGFQVLDQVDSSKGTRTLEKGSDGELLIRCYDADGYLIEDCDVFSPEREHWEDLKDYFPERIFGEASRKEAGESQRLCPACGWGLESPRSRIGDDGVTYLYCPSCGEWWDSADWGDDDSDDGREASREPVIKTSESGDCPYCGNMEGVFLGPLGNPIRHAVFECPGCGEQFMVPATIDVNGDWTMTKQQAKASRRESDLKPGFGYEDYAQEAVTFTDDELFEMADRLSGTAPNFYAIIIKEIERRGLSDEMFERMELEAFEGRGYPMQDRFAGKGDVKWVSDVALAGRMTIQDMADAVNQYVRENNYYMAGALVKDTLDLWRDPKHLEMLEEWVPEGYEGEGVLTARGIARTYLNEVEASKAAPEPLGEYDSDTKVLKLGTTVTAGGFGYEEDEYGYVDYLDNQHADFYQDVVGQVANGELSYNEGMELLFSSVGRPRDNRVQMDKFIKVFEEDVATAPLETESSLQEERPIPGLGAVEAMKEEGLYE